MATTLRRRTKQVPNRTGLRRASPMARALFRNISEAMSDGVMIVDRQGRIDLVNPALGRMLGREPQEIQGRTWAELFFDDREENDAFNDAVLEVIQQQLCHHNRQVTYHPPQGPPRELIVTTDLLLDQDHRTRAVVGMLALFTDITQITALYRREQELLQETCRLYMEKLESLDRLARGVAHEIRNPVMSIGGLSRRLLGQCGDEAPQAQYLERIIASSQRLEQIVCQVRDYADLPAPRTHALGLWTWLKGIARFYQRRAQAQGVALELPEDLPELRSLAARADAKLLNRLMRALMDNALEAMPRGGRLDLGLGRDDASAQAVLTVADTGGGIDPADLPYIFDPFFSTKAAGVGMDLAMAKRIAEEHQGRLSARSVPGQGATFSLSLPLA